MKNPKQPFLDSARWRGWPSIEGPGRVVLAAWMILGVVAGFAFANPGVVLCQDAERPTVALGPPGRLDVSIPRVWLDTQLQGMLRRRPIPLSAVGIGGSFQIVRHRYRNGRLVPNVGDAILSATPAGELGLDLPFTTIHDRQRCDLHGFPPECRWRQDGTKVTVSGRARGRIGWSVQDDRILATYRISRVEDVQPRVGGLLRSLRVSASVDIRSEHEVPINRALDGTDLQGLVNDLDRVEVGDVTPTSVVLHVFLRPSDQ